MTRRKRNTNNSWYFHYNVLEFHYIVLEFPFRVRPVKKTQGFSLCKFTNKSYRNDTRIYKSEYMKYSLLLCRVINKCFWCTSNFHTFVIITSHGNKYSDLHRSSISLHITRILWLMLTLVEPIKLFPKWQWSWIITNFFPRPVRWSSG